jgi:hypothetical protein
VLYVFMYIINTYHIYTYTYHIHIIYICIPISFRISQLLENREALLKVGE